MQVEVHVDAPPPDRRDPGRCADRHSPNAGPLARAAEEVVARTPEAFPLRQPFGIMVTFGETRPQFDGYDAVDPIIEVLVDVGMIEDERLTDWAREVQDPDTGPGYTVIIEPQGSDAGRS